MALGISSPGSTAGYFKLSSTLSRIVDDMKLAGSDDLIVHCFDVGDGDKSDVVAGLPAAWFATKTSDIAINMSTVWTAVFKQPMISRSLDLLFKGPHDPARLAYISETKTGAIYSLASNLASSVQTSAYRMVPAAISGSGMVSTEVIGDKNTEYEYVLKRNFSLDSYYTAPIISAIDPLMGRPSKRAQEIVEHNLHIVIRHVFARLVIGALVHECGHSVFSSYLGSPWYASLTGYKKSILTMFEEIRSEASQTKRIGIGPSVIRGAADVVVDPKQTAEDIFARGVGMSPENTALNSTLLLGRHLYGVYAESEVEDLADVVSLAVGKERYSEMINIWKDTISIYQLETDKLDDVLDRWIELFPAPDDGSSIVSSMVKSEKTDVDDDSSSKDSGSGRDVPTFGDGDRNGDADSASSGTSVDGDDSDEIPGSVFEEAMAPVAEVGESAVAEHVDDSFPAEKKTPRKAYTEAAERTKSERTLIKKTNPTPKDRATARQLANVLRRINVAERAKTTVRTDLPPGRLHTRAAVARSVERRHHATPVAKPWKKTKRDVTHTPPLTVAILTDVSGSQSWATRISSDLTWVLSRAVHEINGTVAAATFGAGVEILCKPGEIMDKKKVRSAVDYTEMFMDSLLTMEHLLQLSTRDGMKVIVVFTDGEFVAPGEMNKTVKALHEYNRQNVLTLWVSPSAKDEMYAGRFKKNPDEARHVPVVEEMKYATGSHYEKLSSELFTRIAGEITRGLSEKKRA